MKKLPIGISDFKEIIEENYYYVDKSLFVEELKHTNGKVILIPRPRRFGKTLNLSMLRYFFEKTEESNERLFHKLAIWNQIKYRKFQGQYPVIFLSFKGVKSRDFETTYEQIVEVIVEEFNRHAEHVMPTLSKQELQDYQAILSRKANRALYENSLFFLTRLLRAYYKKRVYILLDEYDAPLHAAYHYGYYDQLIDFMRSLLTVTFKDNSYLERGVLTGILRVAKEGIFSGLNNLRILTLLDDKFSDKFGFTQSEVDRFLTDFKLLKHKDTIKIWYNGYRCGTTKSLYNPWSFIECVDHKGELLPYWANTSDNALVKKLIARSDESIKTEMEDILSGRSIQKEIQDAIIIPGIENDPQALWGLLLFAGYVTFERYVLKEGKKLYSLVITNKETKLLLPELILQVVKQSSLAQKQLRLELQSL